MVDGERRFHQGRGSSGVGLAMLVGAVAVALLLGVSVIAAGNGSPLVFWIFLGLALVGGIGVPLAILGRARLRELSIGPDGIDLRGRLGLDRHIAWSDVVAVRFVAYRPAWGVGFAVVQLSPGLKSPRVGGGPPVGQLAGRYGHGSPAFAVRLPEFGGAGPIVDAVRTFAPAGVLVEVPPGNLDGAEAGRS
jgi:hypothetical protein